MLRSAPTLILAMQSGGRRAFKETTVAAVELTSAISHGGAQSESFFSDALGRDLRERPDPSYILLLLRVSKWNM